MSAAWPGRLIPDSSTVVLDRGKAVIGGSPLRVLRLSELGAARALAWWEHPDDPEALPPAVLTDRLVDGGLAHPRPFAGPFTSADVTVVIPVHRASASLARTLAALHSTSPDVTRVIVVDDGSPDVDTLRRVTAPWPHVEVHRLPTNRGPAAARNVGLALVATPLVAFLDAGCEPTAGWLTPLLAHFADPRASVVAPRIVAGGASVHGSRALDRYQRARSSLDLGPEPARVRARTRVSYVPAAALLARTEALRAAGGFDEALRVGEDVDLVWRLDEHGNRVRYEPDAEVGHEHRRSLGAWARRRRDYGTAAAPLARRHPGSLAPLGVSAWSVAVWGLVATGRPRRGLLVAAATTALLGRKLDALPHPGRQALRYGGLGHLYAGRSIAAALTGPWWPLLAVLAVASRRVRRVAVAAAVVPALVEWAEVRPELDPARWVVLHTLDDVAYGTGVWLGCLRERTLAPLIPDVQRWPPKAG